MPGNSQRRGRRVTPKKGAAEGTGGKNRARAHGPRPDPARRRAALAQGLLGRREAARAAPPGSRRRSAARRPPRAARPRSASPGTKDTTWQGRRSRHRRRAAATPAARPGGRPARGSRRAASPTPAEGRPGAAGRPQPGGRGAAHARARRPRSTWRTASTSTTGSRRSSRTAGDRGIADARGQPGRAGPDDRRRAAPGHRPAGAAVRVRAVRRPARRRRWSRRAPLLVALDGVTDPRNLGAVDPLGGRVRRAGRLPARAPGRRHDRDRLAHQRRRGRPGADRPGHQPDPGAEGVPGGGLHRRRPGRRRRRPSLYDLEAAVGPLVVVVGSEGRGLSRLVGETCDLRVSIPMVSEVESLNAASPPR